MELERQVENLQQQVDLNQEFAHGLFEDMQKKIDALIEEQNALKTKIETSNTTRIANKVTVTNLPMDDVSVNETIPASNISMMHAADRFLTIVQLLHHRGQKIAAIKEYRNLTGESLKESKDFIEKLQKMIII